MVVHGTLENKANNKPAHSFVSQLSVFFRLNNCATKGSLT